MEPILILVLLAILAFLCIAPVLGFIGWLSSRENRRRLLALEESENQLGLALRRIAELEEKIGEVSIGSPSPLTPPGDPPAVAAARQQQDPVAARRLEESAAAGGDPEDSLEAAFAPPLSAETSSPEASRETEAGDVEVEAPTSPPAPPPTREPLEPEPQALPILPAPPSAPASAPASAPPSALPSAPSPAADSSEDSGQSLPSGLELPEAAHDDGSKIDWERWIGLRGAAVLGGVVLALAALLFLKHSIEAGWIPPVVRVTMAVFVGLGALVGSQSLRGRAYVSTANALAGAGVVILYAAVWAAHGLYGLVGVPIAYSLMTLVTVVCGLLSWRYRTLVVAVLGLLGGFATPALLTTVSENPIGLFSYLLLLNIGLLVLVRQCRWPVLALLSLVLTTLYQASWMFFFMLEGEILLALGVLGAFAVLYTLGLGSRWSLGTDSDGEARQEASSTNPMGPWFLPMAGVFAAFSMTFLLSGSALLTERLVPLAALLLLLSLAAQWLGRLHRQIWMGPAAAGAVVSSLLVWLLRADLALHREWLFVGIAVALAASFHGLVELDLRRKDQLEALRRAASMAAGVAAAGYLCVLLVPVLIGAGGQGPSAVWPWMTGWLALAALLIRQSSGSGFAWIQIAAAAGSGLGVFFLLVDPGRQRGEDSGYIWTFLAIVLSVAVVLQVLSFLGRPGKRRVWAERTAALFPLLVLLGLTVSSSQILRLAWVYHGLSMLLALLIALVSIRVRSGAIFALATGVLAFSQWCWVNTEPGRFLEAGPSWWALGLQFLAAVLFTFWPSMAGRAFENQRWAWCAAALAGPAWFFSMRSLFEAVLGSAFVGVLPLTLGGLSLSSAYYSRRVWKQGDPVSRSSLVWFAAVTLGFISLAVPLQLDREWITVAWALEGLAVLWLWRRLDHTGLKYFGLALLAAVSLRLLLNPEVLLYHEVSGVPIFNWLTYTYLIPAACLIGSAYLLQRWELDRVRPREQPLYGSGKPLWSGVCGFSAILVVFAWINLSILDFFAQGAYLTWSLERSSARDLTTSLAWAVYAVILLVIGIAKNRASLRWISLGFLVLTIGKVFLYDLGELKDLYRVASLVGLAISLILVSLVYQRFVFQRSDPPPS